MIEMLPVLSLVACIGSLSFLLWSANQSIKTLAETLRITLISVTGKEEAELRRLALAKTMSQPKTQYPTPTNSVTKELIEALRRKPGIRHKGERKSFTMTSQDETEENNAPLSGTKQENTDSHP